MNLLFKAKLKVLTIAFSIIILIASCKKGDNESGAGNSQNKKYGTFTDSRDQHVYKTNNLSSK